MTIARSTFAFVGTDETTGVTLTNTTTTTYTQVDVLGDNTSAGEVELYLAFTSTVTAGTLDVTVNKHWVTGGTEQKLAPDFSIAPINGTQLIPLGRISAARFMTVTAHNNGTGASVTNLSVLGELYKFT